MIVAVAAISDARKTVIRGPARMRSGMIAVIITCEVMTKNGEKIPLSMPTVMSATMNGFAAIGSAGDARREPGGYEADEEREAYDDEPDRRQKHGEERRHRPGRDEAHRGKDRISQPNEGPIDVVAGIRREDEGQQEARQEGV